MNNVVALRKDGNAKLCTDCKWHRIHWLERLVYSRKICRELFSTCTRPNDSLPQTSLVDGRKTERRKSSFCSLEREWPDGCGPEGKYWEPKP